MFCSATWMRREERTGGVFLRLSASQLSNFRYVVISAQERGKVLFFLRDGNNVPTFGGK
jgi:hypothetical protein